MKAICFLCEKTVRLDDNSLLAKKLRNNPLKTYLCNECRERITLHTLERLAKRKEKEAPSPSSAPPTDCTSAHS
ncbi:YlaI family protein [Thermicanus aegyptius]|uniref:YlaI family protein n=1 Tax=Thermicanus aegyptius TaxID=94009 RepID=UPI00040C716B|nr:DUF2197 domain-containing protein [Thermicanus aegyptius]